MTRCIVCGLDDTPGSVRAASIASRLARDLGSNALLVNVREATGVLQRLPPASIVSSRRTRRELTALADEHCFPDGTETRVMTGHPASTLLSIAESEDAELIVLGAGGRSTVSVGPLGSVTTTLLREAPCPVVTVPSETVAPLDAKGMRTVVCGVADDDTATATLRLADDLAARLGGQLHAVYAHDQTKAQAPTPNPPIEPELRHTAAERLDAALEGAGVQAHATVAPMPPAQVLQRVAEEQKAGLIVVGFGDHGKGAAIGVGAVPTELAATGRTAVVVMPPAARLEPGSGHYELVVWAT
jgi:nucleotide-binding universal stress UspA family protein